MDFFLKQNRTVGSILYVVYINALVKGRKKQCLQAGRRC